MSSCSAFTKLHFVIMSIILKCFISLKERSRLIYQILSCIDSWECIYIQPNNHYLPDSSKYCCTYQLSHCVEKQCFIYKLLFGSSCRFLSADKTMSTDGAAFSTAEALRDVHVFLCDASFCKNTQQ